MKISENTSFPHPVLAPWLSDIEGASISTDIAFREDASNSEVSIHCAVVLNQVEIAELIRGGMAAFGCYIGCKDTGFRRLQRFDYPTGIHKFAPGAFLGTVHLRPLVWTLRRVAAYSPSGIHPEFGGGCDLQPGEIIALDDEQTIEVTRPPLPSIESIFEIMSSEEIEEGQFALDTGADRITVRMGPKTYSLVQRLRQTDDATRAVVMNSLYVPIVMQVLEELAGGFEPFEQYRWLHPFRARCEQANVQVEKAELLTDAQRLLELPFAALAHLVGEEADSDATS